MALQGTLSHPNRFVTTHDDQGKAIIDATVPPSLPFYQLAGGENSVSFAQCYVTSGFPTSLDANRDVAVYQDYLKSPPGLTVSDGTVLRYVDIPPAHVSPMHRTVSLDYGIVLEGEVELILDSGETRLMKRGDVCVQRATMHAWRNTSETEWARMLYMLQPVKALEVAGQEMKEDYGDMVGVKSSE
ncbi:hypothetical protein QBC39DRAFT_425105 [Podospora conica]|nr:hypothetical protein QBC39DRAFT_425105 [Schizothecium conicum]